MADPGERLAFLEGRVDEQSHMVNGIREAVANLEQRMDRRFEGVDQRLEALTDRMDRRFESLDLRLAALDQKLDGSVAALDQKLDQRFAWLLGAQITTLIAIVAALLAR